MSKVRTAAGQRIKAWFKANVNEFPMHDAHLIDFDAVARAAFDRDDRPFANAYQKSLETELAAALAKEFIMLRQDDRSWIKTARAIIARMGEEVKP